MINTSNPPRKYITEVQFHSESNFSDEQFWKFIWKKCIRIVTEKKKGKEYKNTKERHSPKYQVIYKKDANIS